MFGLWFEEKWIPSDHPEADGVIEFPWEYCKHTMLIKDPRERNDMVMWFGYNMVKKNHSWELNYILDPQKDAFRISDEDFLTEPKPREPAFETYLAKMELDMRFDDEDGEGTVEAPVGAPHMSRVVSTIQFSDAGGEDSIHPSAAGEASDREAPGVEQPIAAPLDALLAAQPNSRVVSTIHFSDNDTSSDERAYVSALENGGQDDQVHASHDSGIAVEQMPAERRVLGYDLDNCDCNNPLHRYCASCRWIREDTFRSIASISDWIDEVEEHREGAKWVGESAYPAQEDCGFLADPLPVVKQNPVWLSWYNELLHQHYNNQTPRQDGGLIRFAPNWLSTEPKKTVQQTIQLCTDGTTPVYATALSSAQNLELRYDPCFGTLTQVAEKIGTFAPLWALPNAYELSRKAARDGLWCPDLMKVGVPVTLITNLPIMRVHVDKTPWRHSAFTKAQEEVVRLDACRLKSDPWGR